MFYLTHFNTVMMLAERERHSWGTASNVVAVKYCEQRRRSWARRTRRGDPSLQTIEALELEAAKIDVTIVTTVKTELASKVDAPKQAATPSAPSTSAPGPGNNDTSLVMESLLSKQNAAVDALARRSQEATRQLAKQQESFMNRTESLLSQTPLSGESQADNIMRIIAPRGSTTKHLTMILLL